MRELGVNTSRNSSVRPMKSDPGGAAAVTRSQCRDGRGPPVCHLGLIRQHHMWRRGAVTPSAASLAAHSSCDGWQVDREILGLDGSDDKWRVVSSENLSAGSEQRSGVGATVHQQDRGDDEALMSAHLPEPGHISEKSRVGSGGISRRSAYVCATAKFVL